MLDCNDRFMYCNDRFIYLISSTAGRLTFLSARRHINERPPGAQTEFAEIDQQGTDDKRSLNREGKQASNLCGAALPSSERGDCRLGGNWRAARLTSKCNSDRRIPVFALRMSRDIAERADGATD
jgi:hypothetical protein